MIRWFSSSEPRRRCFPSRGPTWIFCSRTLKPETSNDLALIETDGWSAGTGRSRRLCQPQDRGLLCVQAKPPENHSGAAAAERFPGRQGVLQHAVPSDLSLGGGGLLRVADRSG